MPAFPSPPVLLRPRTTRRVCRAPRATYGFRNCSDSSSHEESLDNDPVKISAIRACGTRLGIKAGALRCQGGGAKKNEKLSFSSELAEAMMFCSEAPRITKMGYLTETIGALTESVYRVLDEEGRWEHFLGEYARTLRSTMCSLHITNLHTAEWSASQVWGISDEELLEYYQNWEDPWITRIDQATFREGEVRASQLICPDAELESTAVYQKFLQPHGWHYGAGVLIEASQQRHVLLVTLRPKSEGPLSTDELMLFGKIAAPVKRVIRSLASRSAADRITEALTKVFDGLGSGIAIINRDGQLFFSNRRFEKAIEGSRDIGVRDGVLQFLSPLAQRQFERVVSPGANSTQINSILLRTTGGYPRRLTFLTLGEIRNGIPSAHEPAFALVLNDPNARPELDLERGQQLFGLTPAESKLAGCLVDGNSASEAAKMLGISLHTVRAQIKSLFGKTDTSRQADLISLLLRSCVSYTRTDGAPLI
jgi:DNA-binding CsgD family transcriptional regulator/PAS domain-containing protein